MDDLCYVIDENNVDQVLTSIYSLIINGNRELRVNVIAVDCYDVVRSKIGLEFSNSGPIFNIINAKLDRRWQSSVAHVPSVMFNRLRLHEYMPDVDKVLYVDADAIFINDVGDLLDVNVDHVYAAVVDDRNDERGPMYSFNSGVMLLNLSKMRTDRYEASVKRAHELTSGLTSDQAVLNYVFNDDVVHLSPIYNLMISLNTETGLMEYTTQHKLSAKDVRVLHFAGVDKPWSTKVTGSLIYNMYANRAVDHDAQAKLLRLYVGDQRER